MEVVKSLENLVEILEEKYNKEEMIKQ